MSPFAKFVIWNGPLGVLYAVAVMWHHDWLIGGVIVLANLYGFIEGRST